MPNEQKEEEKTVPAAGAAPVETEEEQTESGRNAEARIKELLSKNKELEAKLGNIEVRLNSQPVPTPPVTPRHPIADENPEVAKAIDFLKKNGHFVDQEDMNKQIQDIRNQMILEGEHTRLAGKFDGSDGRPSYNRTEIENYMRTHGVWNPEVAYEQLNKNELFDWEVKKMESDKKKKPFIAKPLATSTQTREEGTITREKIQGWLEGGPEGRAQYEQNRDKILKMMADGQLQ